MREMKRRRQRLPKGIAESRSARRRIPFLGEWKRSWGRPPLHVIIGTLLFPILFVAMLTGVILYLLSMRELIAFALILVVLGLWIWLMRSFLKYVTYLQSFRMERSAQTEVDRQFEEVAPDDGESTEGAAQTSIDRILDELQRGFVCAAVSEREKEQFNDFLKSLHLEHPDRRPRLLEVVALDKQGRRCLFGIIEFDREVQVGKRRHHETVVSCVAQLQLPCSLGRVTIRSRDLADYLAALFTDTDVATPQSPGFGRKYYCTSSDPERTQQFLSPQVLAVFSGRDDIVVQIHNAIVLVGQDRPFEEVDPGEIAALSLELLGHLSSACALR